LTEINTIEDNAIPDVDLNTQNADEIYMLYRAGILSGNDKTGIFTPNANIQRSAVATIVARMVNRSLRQSFLLTKVPVNNYKQIYSDKGSYCILNKNEQVFITADFGSGNIVNKDIEWASSNIDIATVNNGLVCGNRVGRAVITASYNGIAATCIVLVASEDGSPVYAGTMAIKKDGVIYKSSISKHSWAGEVKYLDDSPAIYVYTINGEYYINDAMLLNFAHCYYGEAIIVYSDNPYIKEPQLCGSANLRFSSETHIDYISAEEKIHTYITNVTLPNKDTLTYDFVSEIYFNGKVINTVHYNNHSSHNEVMSNGSFSMWSIEHYMEIMNIKRSWHFDDDTKQLIFELD
jgi:hypothetical protein